MLSWANLAISGRFYFCARKLIYFRILSSWIHIWREKCSTVLQNFPSLGKNVENCAKIEVSCRPFSYGKADIFPSSEMPCSFLSTKNSMILVCSSFPCSFIVKHPTEWISHSFFAFTCNIPLQQPAKICHHVFIPSSLIISLYFFDILVETLSLFLTKVKVPLMERFCRS